MDASHGTRSSRQHTIIPHSAACTQTLPSGGGATIGCLGKDTARTADPISATRALAYDGLSQERNSSLSQPLDRHVANAHRHPTGETSSSRDRVRTHRFTDSQILNTLRS